MDTLLQLVYAVVIAGASLAPAWVAGRRAIPARERLPWRELDLVMAARTLARGAAAIRPVAVWERPDSHREP